MNIIQFIQPYAINTTSEWCSVCNNTVNRGCDALAAAYAEGYAAASGSPSSRSLAQRSLNEPSVPVSQIGEVGAGFIGVGATLLLELIVLGMLSIFGLISLSRKKKAAVHLDDDASFDSMSQFK
jgi:prostatic aicd phosphatase